MFVWNNLTGPDNLFPNFVHPERGEWGPRDMSVGALGDSFYEYLLKEWIRCSAGHLLLMCGLWFAVFRACFKVKVDLQFAMWLN